MPAQLNLGDNYSINENSNGNLEIVDSDGTAVARHDDASDQWELFDPTTVLELTVTSEITDAAGVTHSGELADLDDTGSSGVSDHGNLNGLGDDDHTQYLLVNGTRSMSGGLDMGSNAISNISSITASGTADAGAYTIGGSSFASSVVASGSVTLSSGSASIDTGVAASSTATFQVALGPDTDDADVAADIKAVSGGNYEVDIQETDTSVGNPTIRYDIIRVR